MIQRKRTLKYSWKGVPICIYILKVCTKYIVFYILRIQGYKLSLI